MGIGHVNQEIYLQEYIALDKKAHAGNMVM